MYHLIRMTNKIILYLLGILSLLVGFFFKEDASGGAILDHTILFKYSIGFSDNFYQTLVLFLNAGNENSVNGSDHSPVFFIISGLLIKLFNSVEFFKFFYLLISSLMPFLFYLILKVKFKSNKNLLYFFSLLVFFSPYFRASAIWTLGDNLALIFFELFVLYFLKAENKFKSKQYFFYSLIFLVLSCYIRPIFCFFWIFYIYMFYKKNNFYFFIVFFNLSFVLALPAIVYLYQILFVYTFSYSLKNYLNLNYLSNSFQIFSIIFFYLIPFIFLNFSLFKKILNKNLNFICYITFFILALFFINYFFNLSIIDYGFKGGGIFRKIANIFKVNEYLALSITSILGIVSTICFCDATNKNRNLLLFISLVLCYPLSYIYQKYLDPIYLFIYFGLVNSNFVNEMFKKNKLNMIFLYSYFFLFLVSSNIYYTIR